MVAETGETGEVAGTTDTGLGSKAPPAEVAASETGESDPLVAEETGERRISPARTAMPPVRPTTWQNR